MLRYTGHPLLDVGIATIVAFAKKERPEDLTEKDLEAIADYMAKNYTVNPLRSYLTVAFPNSGFTQPAFFKQPEKQEIYKERVFRAFRQKPSGNMGEQDAYFGLPAANISFNVPKPGKPDLPPGRAYRQHIPLLTGEDVINFFPNGDAGLPVSGLAMLAIQAIPLGSAKCSTRHSGRLVSVLSVHSDNPRIMLEFAKRFLQENRVAINIAQQSANSKTMPGNSLKYQTLLVEILTSIIREQRDALDESQPFSITAYHWNNSGKGANLAIYYFPSQVIIFLKEMLSADYKNKWEQIVRRAWVREKLKRGQKEPSLDFKPNRNFLYEDLFRLMEDVHAYAPRFIRTYFLRVPYKYTKQGKDDPRQEYSLQKEAQYISWNITERFLRRIMNMDSERIENIRKMGDALASYIRAQNDKRFFRTFYVENRYGYLRNALIKANTAYVKSGHEPFLTLDNYLSVFEEGEDLPYSNWRLARDLVLIRMVEQLYQNGWLGDHQDALPETDEFEKEEGE